MIDLSLLEGEQLSASDSISGRLDQLIRSGKLRAGDRIPAERELSAHLGVSRAVVRDAFRDLEMRGLISRRPGRGTLVTQIPRPEVHAGLLGTMDGSTRMLREVMDLRAVVEPPIAERAASRATKDQVQRLQALVDQATREFAAEGALEHLAQLDVDFHTSLAQMTGNPILERLLAVTNGWMAPSRSQQLQSHRRIRSSLNAHRLILDAVQRRDPLAARTQMATHIEEILVVITGDTP